MLHRLAFRSVSLSARLEGCARLQSKASPKCLHLQQPIRGDSTLRSLRHMSTSRQAAAASEKMTETPVRDAIHAKITTQLKPESLDVIDESSQHAGHAAMKGLSSSETHFRLSIVSQAFEGLPTIKRHKLVYQVLTEEMAGPIHALSLRTKTPSEVSQD